MSEIITDKITGRGVAKTITVTVGATATQSLGKGLAKVYSLWDMGDLSGTGGTTGIDTSLNVSSMDDDGAGDFGINFTVTFETTNYVAVSATGNGIRRVLTRSPDGTATTTSMDGLIRNDSNTNADAVSCSVAIFGDVA